MLLHVSAKKSFNLLEPAFPNVILELHHLTGVVLDSFLLTEGLDAFSGGEVSRVELQRLLVRRGSTACVTLFFQNHGKVVLSFR